MPAQPIMRDKRSIQETISPAPTPVSLPDSMANSNMANMSSAANTIDVEMARKIQEDAQAARIMAERALERIDREQKERDEMAARERERISSRREDTGDDGSESDNFIGINPKFVKQLQNTVGIFNALKDFVTNPLQQAIEKRVGDVAATVVENAFSPRGPPQKKDLVETFLNSQFAYGLGAGLGQRAPELVDTLSKNFGQQKTEEMIDTMMGKYGKSGGGSGNRQLTEGGSVTGGNGNKKESSQQSNIELLLSLDPNNPEHVAAYAESQGGISIDTARKMLMVHQDDIIKRMKPREGYSQDSSQVQVRQYDTPIQHPEPPVQQQPVQHPEPPIKQYDTSVQQQPDNIYFKQFTQDLGKVIGDMTNKIDILGNTVLNLQNELRTMKSRKDEDIPIEEEDKKEEGRVQTLDEFKKELEEEARQDSEKRVEEKQVETIEPQNILSVSSDIKDADVIDIKNDTNDNVNSKDVILERQEGILEKQEGILEKQEQRQEDRQEQRQDNIRWKIKYQDKEHKYIHDNESGKRIIFGTLIKYGVDSNGKEIRIGEADAYDVSCYEKKNKCKFVSTSYDKYGQ